MSRKWMLRILVATTVAAGLVGTATVAGATANSDHIWAGESLVAGAYQTSVNGQYRLIQQQDGNLVEYQRDQKGNYSIPIWSTGTARNPGAATFLQKDGKMIVYLHGKALKGNDIWATNTGDPSVSHLTVQNDGNVVIYNKSGKALWASKGLNSSRVGDDYPTKWQSQPYPSEKTDSWGQYVRYCTSFVAWRLHDRNGYELPRWRGNANSWDDMFKSQTDSHPRVGAVAQTDNSPGGMGHVAWVAEVSGKQVLLEEYNYNTPGGYGKRWVDAGSYRYIHLNN